MGLGVGVRVGIGVRAGIGVMGGVGVEVRGKDRVGVGVGVRVWLGEAHHAPAAQHVHRRAPTERLPQHAPLTRLVRGRARVRV